MTKQHQDAEIRSGERVVDPCCGSPMMYLDRNHPDVVFGDQRDKALTLTDPLLNNQTGTRTLRIEVDLRLDFRHLPYADGSLKKISFDPPHLVRAGSNSWLAANYGKLGPDWRDDIRRGFAECCQAPSPDGVLVFKWNEAQIKGDEVLALAAVHRLFGHPIGRKGLTHWLVLMKPAGQDERCEAPIGPC